MLWKRPVLGSARVHLVPPCSVSHMFADALFVSPWNCNYASVFACLSFLQARGEGMADLLELEDIRLRLKVAVLKAELEHTNDDLQVLV